MKKRNLNASLRACRSNRSPLCFRQTGFTIVELMMSVVLLAIGAALSLPSYREMVEKRQLTHGAEQILAFINTAQTEAAARNQIVTISYDRDDWDDWCIGAALGTSACDCTETNTAASDFCAIDATPRIINNSYVGNTQLVKEIDGAEGAYSIDPIRGIVIDPDDKLKIEMRSASQDYRLDLRVNISGQAILCSNGSDHKVPGYAEC